MKVNILLAAAIALSFSSCKKEISSLPDESQHALCFNLNGFSQTLTDIKGGAFISSETLLKDNFQYLYYQIFNADGNLVHHIEQTAADANFGTIKDYVPTGDYTVILVGSKTAVIPAVPSTLNVSKLNTTAADDDIFVKKMKVTVQSSDVTQGVILDRINSFIELNVQDALPAEVSSVDLVIQNEYPVFQFQTESYSNGVVVDKRVTKTISGDADRNALSICSCVMNNYTPVTVLISCFDAKHNTLKVVKVPNVQCVRNKKTILSGKLYSMPESGFTVGVNAGLSGDPIIVPF